MTEEKRVLGLGGDQLLELRHGWAAVAGPAVQTSEGGAAPWAPGTAEGPEDSVGEEPRLQRAACAPGHGEDRPLQELPPGPTGLGLHPPPERLQRGRPTLVLHLALSFILQAGFYIFLLPETFQE